MKNQKTSLLSNDGVQTLLASIICIFLGLVAGYVVLLTINPAGAFDAIIAILKNFMTFPSKQRALQYFGSTLVKAAPLLMCSLSVLFAYKVGLFNIGASGQYTVGAGAALYLALAYHMPWYVCLIAAMIAGGVLGAASGALKAYRNVNEVIACIMLNWISLYSVNMLLTRVKESTTTYTEKLTGSYKGALLPSLGMGEMFAQNKYVTIAIPLSIVIAVVVWVVLEKTKLGYELKATGLNKNAAKYAGMKEKKNMILTMFLSGCLSGMGAAFYYLSGIEQWSCAQTSVPGMGFNGVAAAFLGGVHPIGCVFSSYFIQHITSGGSYVDKTLYCSQISDLISAIIIYLCGFVLFFKLCLNGYLRNKAEKAEQKKGGKE